MAQNRKTQHIETRRLEDRHWLHWGPYLSERQWGTVREDYSPKGDAWQFFPHDHARSRAYRWGEDGIGGISDIAQQLCFSVALWNERDPMLKERLFGLSGPEGNHGEDVKELYYYLDSSPTHSWLSMLYKYPQAEFPYRRLVEENQRRTRYDREFEVIDTGAFADNRYFDVFIEYAKASPEDICVRIRVINRGAHSAPCHLIPLLWFRNTWSWEKGERPRIRELGNGLLSADHPHLGEYFLAVDGDATLLFCENESNAHRLWGSSEKSAAKDGINDAVVRGDRSFLSPDRCGSRLGIHYSRVLESGEEWTVRLRLSREAHTRPFADHEQICAARRMETDTFYAALGSDLDEDARTVQRQACAGMLWSKQFYHYEVEEWLDGDPAQPAPPGSRRRGRNAGWSHLHSNHIISMPDKWEYPWFAAWDLAFHCVPLTLLDPVFAKEQLLLLTTQEFLHPNGQLPAYEWNFSDVNPPVHAWAALKVYTLEAERTGRGDRAFLERMFHKLLLNFTWWVNRKDEHAFNIFQGGFLGLDNIGVFDRSAPLPTGGHVEQADGTAWMGMYSLNMMRIALELARENASYEDLAIKFVDHFLRIAQAMVNIGGEGLCLWDNEDEFYYDVLHTGDDEHIPLKVRSLVGLIPLLAVEVLDPELLTHVPGFTAYLDKLFMHRDDLAQLVSRWEVPGMGERRLLSLVRGHRMKRLLFRMLDEQEFLSPFGIRALSRYHLEHPYRFDVGGMTLQVSYQPGESESALFGGNSNWRGPIWFPINYLLIESIDRFATYYGEDFVVEHPTGSGQKRSLSKIAAELSGRLCSIFLKNDRGERPVHGGGNPTLRGADFHDYVLFYEYFDGESGRGVGASHQTGWTGLVADLLFRRASLCGRPGIGARGSDVRGSGRGSQAEQYVVG